MARGNKQSLSTSARSEFREFVPDTLADGRSTEGMDVDQLFKRTSRNLDYFNGNVNTDSVMSSLDNIDSKADMEKVYGLAYDMREIRDNLNLESSKLSKGEKRIKSNIEDIEEIVGTYSKEGRNKDGTIYGALKQYQSAKDMRMGYSSPEVIQSVRNKLTSQLDKVVGLTNELEVNLRNFFERAKSQESKRRNRNEDLNNPSYSEER